MNDLKQALILCGGKGQRLRPITNSIPKPLVPINKIPILCHQIEYLQKEGISDFILATGYKSEMIEAFILESFKDIKIRVVNSGDVDIYNRIYDCKKYLKNKFLLCYGDTLADINILELNKFYSKKMSRGIITIYQLQSQFGIIKSNDDLVYEYLEKPKLDAWINIGYFILDKSLIIKSNHNFVDFIDSLVRSKQLYAYKHDGLHITVNTVKELQEAELNIKYFK